MKTLIVRVADELFAEIASAARARNVPKSEIVRERLIHKVAAAKRAEGSLWSRMDDLVIQSDSLPADLSVNAHLKNYGQNRPHRLRRDSRGAATTPSASCLGAGALRGGAVRHFAITILP